MNTVKQILNSKGTELWSIEPDASVYDAICLMAEKEIGALVVIEDEQLAGVISERDYARQVVLKGRSSETTRVKDIMTKRVVYASPGLVVEDCLALMTEKRIRHLPIVDDKQILGVISMGDLVKSIIDEQKQTIDQLQHYITG